jgi:hypothetical protein
MLFHQKQKSRRVRTDGHFLSFNRHQENSSFLQNQLDYFVWAIFSLQNSDAEGGAR